MWSGVVHPGARLWPVVLLILVIQLALFSAPARAQSLEDLSAFISVTTANERSTLDRVTRKITSRVDITFTNSSNLPFVAPIHAVVTVSSPNVQMPDALGGPGAGPYGTYYQDLSPLLGSGLAPGASVTLELRFVRNSGVTFTYQVRPYGTAPSDPLPPVIVVSPPLAMTVEGEPVTLHVSAMDPNGGPVSISATPRLRNARFSVVSGAPAEGEFTFTPDFGQQGMHLLAFTARDADGMTSTAVAGIQVDNMNRPPVVSVQETAEVNEGAVLVIPVTAYDPDGDPLTVQVGPLPDNAVYVQAAGSITFAPGYDQAGVYAIVCQADDGQAQSDPRTVVVTVIDVPEGQGGDGELRLELDPVQSPTFLPTQRVTGAVNNSGGPAAEAPKTALITSLDPTVATQGAAIEVMLSGPVSGPYAPHFVSGVTSLEFGPGIAVESLTVLGPGSLRAVIAVDPLAALGPRSVRAVTRDETAVSVLAFSVSRGHAVLSGRLLDPETGLPLVGAAVTVAGTNLTALTDSEGRFRIQGAPTGPIQIIVNPPDYEFMALSAEAVTGQTIDLGDIEPRPTVFNPNAPPSATTLSVVGRGATDPTGRIKPGRAVQIVMDALLAVGGDEAGVLDEYGSQLNPALADEGLLSVSHDGVQMLADRLSHGESRSLQELLYALSFAFEWSHGPLDIEEWLDGLQEGVNEAWQDPTAPSNALPVLMFNKGRFVLPEPPTLSPHTRLNALQSYLLVSSLLTYAVMDELPQHAKNATAIGFGEPIRLAYAGEILGHLLLGQAPSRDYFTRYWRNFFTTKQTRLQMSHDSAFVNEANTLFSTNLLAMAGGLGGGLTAVMLVGDAPQFLANAMVNTGYALLVPDPPSIVRAEVQTNPDGTPRVQLSCRPSPSQASEGPTVTYFYRLYRFSGPDERRDLVAGAMYDGTESFEFGDPAPVQGTSFYALNVTRYTGLDTPPTESWWPPAFEEAGDVFRLGGRRLTSDYSAPVSVYVGPGDYAVTLDGLEPHPDPDKDLVYYSDAGQGVFYRIERSGEGVRTPFAQAGFKSSYRDGRTIVQVGLAIDGQGNLYADNAASDAAFGGRIFRFNQPNGSREFCGTVNYFSQLLMFAHPCQAGQMVIKPSASVTEQDLIIAEDGKQVLLRIPVNQTYDPTRRVGQPYAALPSGDAFPGGWGRVIDMEFGPSGELYVLDGLRVVRFVGDVPTLDALFTPKGP